MGEHDHLLWHELEREPLLDAPVFRVFSSRRRAADGAESSYVLVESADWCNVIAPTTLDDGRRVFVMARQFRHGSRALTVEFPGGIVDPGEEPERAAMREFHEETGYSADRLVLIGRTNPNPAFMSNTAWTFLAERVQAAGARELDATEKLDVELVPEHEVVDLLRPDFTEHAIMLGALHWYTCYREDGLTYQERLERWERHG